MANDQRLSIDLLAIPGAKLYKLNMGTAEKPDMQTCVCIPANEKLNGIEVKSYQRENGQTDTTAYVNMTTKSFSAEYIQKALANATPRQGETQVKLSDVASHEIKMNCPKSVFDTYKERIAQQVLKQHPEWAGQSLEPAERGQRSSDLYYAVRDRINKRVGKAFTNSNEVQVQAAAVDAQPVFMQPAAPAQTAPKMAASGEAGPEDDLPF